MAEYLWSNLVPGGRFTKVDTSYAVEKVTSSKKLLFSNPDHHFPPQRLNALLYAPPYEFPYEWHVEISNWRPLNDFSRSARGQEN